MFRFLIRLLIICMPTYSFASTNFTSWQDLTFKYEAKKTSFGLLDYNEKLQLTAIAYSMADPDLYEESQEKIHQLSQQLASKNMELETLLQEREEAIKRQNEATKKPNPDLVNTRVEIAGFVVPLEMDNLKVTSFFLVPTEGACIHTPPPQPNQIILVEYSQGFELERLSKPVIVSGLLTSEANTLNTQFSDGDIPISSVYQLRAENTTHDLSKFIPN